MTLLDERLDDPAELTARPPIRAYEVLAHVRVWVETPGLVDARRTVERVLHEQLAPVAEITSTGIEIVGVQPVVLE